jgi:hypothetical protein
MSIETRPKLQLAESQTADLGGSIERIAAELAGEGAMSAPVHLPPRSKLALHLVDVRTLSRLDEAQSDASVFQSLFWAIFGGLLGVGTSSFASHAAMAAMDSTTAVLFAVLGMGSALMGFFWWRYSKRAKVLKAEILSESSTGNAQL